MTRTLVFATISLDNMAGGLERNIVFLCNEFAKRGFRVYLLTFDYEKAQSFFPIDSRVNWIKCGRTPPHQSISISQKFKLLKRIRTTLRKIKGKSQNVKLVCFHHGILSRMLASSLFLSIPVICSERNSLSLYGYIKRRKWNINFILLALVHRITVQFPSYVKDYPIWVQKRIRVIGNPVKAIDQIAKPHIPNPEGRYTIINAGRLCTQKGQALIIRAFSEISDQFPSWDLILVGSGGLKSQLKSEIDRLGLSSRIEIIEKTQNLERYLKSSHLFCFPSQWEGFPNALAEAMAHGLPAIGLASCRGTNDLIRHLRSGLLVDHSQLAIGLALMMSSPEIRRTFGQASIDIISQYTPERTISSWLEVVEGNAVKSASLSTTQVSNPTSS